MQILRLFWREENRVKVQSRSNQSLNCPEPMKTHQDPRHLKRIHIMQDLFTWEFHAQKVNKDNTAWQVIQNLTQIDEEIKKAAPTWPLDKINKIDLSILRLAIFELIIVSDTPYKVIVDEAVELAKEFGTEASPGFINGALGNIIFTHSLEKEKNE